MSKPKLQRSKKKRKNSRKRASRSRLVLKASLRLRRNPCAPSSCRPRIGPPRTRRRKKNWSARTRSSRRSSPRLSARGRSLNCRLKPCLSTARRSRILRCRSSHLRSLRVRLTRNRHCWMPRRSASVKPKSCSKRNNRSGKISILSGNKCSKPISKVR